MDHAWYVRDVYEMRAWRRIGAVAWSFALAALFALAYITLTSTPTLRASAWAARLGASLAYAATQLPLAALVAAMLRPSLAPLRVVGGGVDPWGVFAPPGSEARWAGARAPTHLFPAGFAASRWVSHSAPESPPDEMARDALGLAALLLAHVAAGAAGCALLATAARGDGVSCCDDASHGRDGYRREGHEHASVVVPVIGAVSSCAFRAARYGTALGAVVAAHWVRSGARHASFAPVSRPRLYRAKRAVAPAFREGATLACVAVLVAVLVAVAFPMADEASLASHAIGDVSARVPSDDALGDVLSSRLARFPSPLALFAAAARAALGACAAFLSALGHAPVGCVVAATALVSRAAAETVLTERYRFLPQSLDGGAAAACAPLLASLAARETPWAQSLAYLDLCEVCSRAHGEANSYRRDLLLEASSTNGGGVSSSVCDAYVSAVAAALAPVLSVASATRAALDAAERAEREAAGGGARLGKPRDASGASGAARVAAARDALIADRGAGGIRPRSARGARVSSDGSVFATARGGGGDDAGGSAAAPPESPRRADSRRRAFAAHASRRAGDAVASAAWAATADEWGMPSAVAPAAPGAFGAEDVTDRPGRGSSVALPGPEPAPRGGSVLPHLASDAARQLTRGFVEDEAARREGDARRARAGGRQRAPSLSRQMESPRVLAAREAKAVLAAHGQMAQWGARAATDLACAGAADVDPDAARVSPRENPIDASAVLRVLVAAARAADACAAAGGAASASGRFPQARARVPELRDARAACAALADTFRACVHAFAEAYGAEETRRMLLATSSDAGAGRAVPETDRAMAFDRPASADAGEDGAATRELVATLETILRWE